MSERYRELWAKADLGKVDGTTPIDPQFWSHLESHSHLLEVGVGWGRVAYKCIQRGFRVTGIDVNSAEVFHLNQKLVDAGVKTNLVIGSATDLPFNQKIFEGAFLQGLLSALNVVERAASLREVRRVVHDGGVIHIAEFQLTENNNRRYIQDMAITGEYGTLSVKDNKGTEIFRTHNFRQDEICELLTITGFEVISFKETMFQTFKGKLKPGMTIISRKKT